MDKRSVWWTAVVVIVLEAVARAIQHNALRNAGAAFPDDPLFFLLLHFTFGTGLLVGFVALVNEKRRWPLVVLIALAAVQIPVCFAWIRTADESGRITEYGPAYPVAVWWISGAVAALGLVAFAWHYWRYRRTVWIRRSRSES